MRMVAIFLVMLYNLTILGTTTYLVAVHNWNPWWFLFSVLLLGTSKSEDKK